MSRFTVSDFPQLKRPTRRFHVIACILGLDSTGKSSPAHCKSQHDCNRDRQNELRRLRRQHSRHCCANEETRPYVCIETSTVKVTVPGAFGIGERNTFGRESEMAAE